MFTINEKDNSIELTRGDSASFTLSLSDYEISDSDDILFTVKKRITDADPVLQLTAEGGVFVFQPSDTIEMSPGTYLYDIQLTTESGQVYTVIQSTISFFRGVTE